MNVQKLIALDHGKSLQIFSPELGEVVGTQLWQIAVDEYTRFGTSKLAMQHDGWSSLKRSAGEWHHEAVYALDRAVILASSGLFANRKYWFNFSQKGGWTDWHTHELSDVALVYWPDCGNQNYVAPGGELELAGLPPISPTPDTLLMFAADLPHRVLKTQGDLPRFSMACNLGPE